MANHQTPVRAAIRATEIRRMRNTAYKALQVDAPSDAG
jgi:hypothetical protein